MTYYYFLFLHLARQFDKPWCAFFKSNATECNLSPTKSRIKNNTPTQGFLVMANQDHIVGKLKLADSNKVVCTSPIKYFTTNMRPYAMEKSFTSTSMQKITHCLLNILCNLPIVWEVVKTSFHLWKYKRSHTRLNQLKRLQRI